MIMLAFILFPREVLSLWYGQTLTAGYIGCGDYASFFFSRAVLSLWYGQTRYSWLYRLW